MNRGPFAKVACIFLALGLALAASGCVNQSAGTSDDPYLWLEEPGAAKALAWVAAQNATTARRFAQGPSFAAGQARALEVLDSDARIPYVSKRGELYYNFWRDGNNPRGLWRRTTLAQYRTDRPQWEVLLDVDALGKAEGNQWVFDGADWLRPSYARCLVSLSPDGGDAATVREFDPAARRFVKGGFEVPAAKSEVGWIDANALYVGTDFGPGSMTDSSYPRIAKRWQRGTPLSAAQTVFECKPDDISASADHDPTVGFERDFVGVQHDFYHSDTYLLDANGRRTHLDVPPDSQPDAHRQWLLVQLRSVWKVGGREYASGALLAINFDGFLAGRRDFVELFRPTATTSLVGYTWTRHHLVLNILDDVAGRLEVLTPADSGDWQRRPLAGPPKFSSVGVVDADPDSSDEYWLSVTGFLSPATLLRGVLGEGDAETIKRSPAFFDANGLEVSQHFATSRDGTRVPYFQVAPKGMKLDGASPTLLYGYGGFEDSLRPWYDGVTGRAWLARGGVYVVANIRGGGEYGPAWHQAALQGKRLRAYEDFAVVAEDLVRRKVTSPAHLGCEGGSNGGLLVGNMLTLYPRLFGAVACESPLLDMKRYTHLSAGASWIAEYGDPDKPDQWEFLKKFSPYHNLKAGVQYPPVLFYTSSTDDRVGPGQARKMAARMQALGIGNVWFYENTEGGHGAAADHKQEAFMLTLIYDFLWDRLK
jgi:prolyl oligopeptidase